MQLEVARTYHDIYTFDSKKEIPCLGLIKDLVVTLAQFCVKSVVLDIVVTDIPPKCGMLMSRYCCAKLGGSLQIDMFYTTTPVYGGDHLRLYIEVRLMNNFGRFVKDKIILFMVLTTTLSVLNYP